MANKGLLQEPGPAWVAVSIHTDEDFADEAACNLLAIMAWFRRRAGSMREFNVQGSTQKLPSSLVVVVLSSQAASLRVLSLDVAFRYNRVLIAGTGSRCNRYQ